jgi:hypothetical protein
MKHSFASIPEARRYLEELHSGRFMLCRVREDRFQADGRDEHLETFWVHDQFEDDAVCGETLGEAVAKAEDRLRAMVAHG